MNKAILSLNFMYSMERFATAIYRVQKGGFKEAFISQKMSFAVNNEWQHASKLKKGLLSLIVSQQEYRFYFKWLAARLAPSAGALASRWRSRQI